MYPVAPYTAAVNVGVVMVGVYPISPRALLALLRCFSRRTGERSDYVSDRLRYVRMAATNCPTTRVPANNGN